MEFQLFSEVIDRNKKGEIPFHQYGGYPMVVPKTNGSCNICKFYVTFGTFNATFVWVYNVLMLINKKTSFKNCTPFKTLVISTFILVNLRCFLYMCCVLDYFIPRLNAKNTFSPSLLKISSL